MNIAFVEMRCSSAPRLHQSQQRLLVDWRVRVAQGRASSLNGILYLTEGSEMSESDWVARHVTAH
ncbi:hypothetical protein [Methylobacterium thuringiense]|uniref:Uncharacterized protein n=1 Tax=Methylobacterium thuringiense TaxID=1003091 RepID=A0ABQ4TRN2_9HYPH|nr:hypothetical protein [Methylobacterium thuringiense]GJE57312.1 hypothetical protein EKPJFOCH_3826 [Methylobacterium thuringiense]